MKLFDSSAACPLALSFALLGFLSPPSWADAGDALFGNANVAPVSNFDGSDIFGSGAPGNIDPTTGQPIGNLGNPGVLGESHPGWGANQVNGGDLIPGQISDYPNWSSVGSRYGGNGPNQRHQFPIGVRGGLPDTTSKLIAPDGDYTKPDPIQTSGFEGTHTFGFTGDKSQQYLGVTSTSRGVAPQSGGTLPPTSTGSVGLKITEGDCLPFIP